MKSVKLKVTHKMNEEIYDEIVKLSSYKTKKKKPKPKKKLENCLLHNYYQL